MSSGAWIEMIYSQNAFMPFVALAKSNAKFSLYFSVCLEGVFRDKHTKSAPHCALCCGACGQAGSLSTHTSLMVTSLSFVLSEPLQMTKSPQPNLLVWMWQGLERACFKTLSSFLPKRTCPASWLGSWGRPQRYPSAPGSYMCAGVLRWNLFFFLFFPLKN